MWAGIIAAVIGLLGTVYASRQNKKSQEMILREQRAAQEKVDLQTAAANSKIASDTLAANAAAALKEAQNSILSSQQITARDANALDLKNPTTLLLGAFAVVAVLIYWKAR
jgi:hypothetical protein